MSAKTKRTAAAAIFAAILAVAGALIPFLASNDPKVLFDRAKSYRDVIRAQAIPVSLGLVACGVLLIGAAVATGYWIGRKRPDRHLPAADPRRYGLCFGLTRTAWVRLETTPTKKIEWDQITCRLSRKFVVPPVRLWIPELYEWLRIVRKAKHNSTLLAIFDIRVRTAQNIEKRLLFLEFGTTRYARFLVPTVNRFGRAVRNRALAGWQPDDRLPPWLMQGVGVQIAVLTSDQQLILVRRSVKGTTPRAGELDVGAVEGMSKHLDIGEARSSGRFDLRAIMERALREEFGIPLNRIRDLEVLTLGYDLAYSQVNFIGLAQVQMSASEVQHSWQHDSETREEFSQVFGVPFDETLEAVCQRIQDERLWSSGMATIRSAAVRMFGSATVEGALRQFAMAQEDQYG